MVGPRLFAFVAGVHFLGFAENAEIDGTEIAGFRQVLDVVLFVVALAYVIVRQWLRTGRPALAASDLSRAEAEALFD